MNVIQESFGEIGGHPVTSFSMVNDNGVEVTAINYGCIITKIVAPDKHGNYENIVLGHDTLKDYVKDPYYLGAVVGRVAGRIKGGSFELDGKIYNLAKNDPPNHLHGGDQGFNRVIWNAEIIDGGVSFSYFSPDREEGYPGNVNMQVTYLLDNNNQLHVYYEGHTDQKTLLTVTNHSYFNLSGNIKKDILDHALQIKSDRFLELDHEFIPTGNFIEVGNSPFDFRSGREINIGSGSEHPQNVLVGEGYDHPFLLNINHDNEIVLKDFESGRILTIETDEPAVVVYTGNSLKPEGCFRRIPSRKYLGICLETQGLPDAIHHPHFPGTIIDSGETYSSKTVYKFGIETNEE
ncbi:aldose epimerase family protein [Peribacillus sp. SCS-155]|uniref:aldose epimerase family protein n=1 Tax=Peribacillus sedimenti TaxID=3115297 RepID=UPI003906CFA6